MEERWHYHAKFCRNLAASPASYAWLSSGWLFVGHQDDQGHQELCLLEVLHSSLPNCQLQTSIPSKPIGLLHPLDVPPFVWHTVNTDYITGLPVTADRNNAIAVFVDKLTNCKYICMQCLALTLLMLLTGQTLMQHVVKHEGLCFVIMSDKGPQINRKLYRALAIRLGIFGIFLQQDTLRLMARLGESTMSLRMFCDILLRPT